ncbi:hypothetical protein vseg_007885 [Gypsophila vaccaria]
MWSMAPEFQSLVKGRWCMEVKGHVMFQVVHKLKILKSDLRKLNTGLFSNVEHSADMAVQLLHSRQIDLQARPDDLVLLRAEKEAAISSRFLLEANHRFLIQRAKAKWVQDGDENTTFFHSCIKERRQGNRVVMIRSISGGMAETSETIQNAFLEYYQQLLGSNAWVEHVHELTVQKGQCVREDQWPGLLASPTAQEIKEAIFDIEDTKSPGLDGYTSKFFKDAWGVIGHEVIHAVTTFFQNGKLLQQVNNTSLVLVPKLESPMDVKDFRPIACCNVIYKCISKLMCNKLSGVLSRIICES